MPDAISSLVGKEVRNCNIIFSIIISIYHYQAIVYLYFGLTMDKGFSTHYYYLLLLIFVAKHSFQVSDDIADRLHYKLFTSSFKSLMFTHED